VVSTDRGVRRIGVISGGVILVAGLAIFFVMAAWRIHGPNFSMVDGGWMRLTDRRWGFEIDLPKLTTKTSEGMTSERYDTSFENGPTVRIRIQKWPLGSNRLTPTEELASILKRERNLRPVELLKDQSNGRTSAMIDYVSTCGQSSTGIWYVRERVIIHRDVLLRISVPLAENKPIPDVDRLMNSVRWLR
jgi:hypothetical protein